MESIEQLSRQLDSIDDLRTIVKTMKALSGANIAQYEQAVAALRGYYQTVERGLYVVLKELDMPPEPVRRSRDPQRLAAIIFGSDHGLCGRFNEEITRYAVQRMGSHSLAPKDRLALAVGARVAASLEHEGQKITQELRVPGSADHITKTVQQILFQIEEWRDSENVHTVYLFYNQHAEGESNRPTGIRLLPINLRRFHRLREERWPSRSLPTFSMNREILLRHLLHQYLFVSIFRACAQSQASEHTSRLAAMRSAQRNLDDRFEDVTMAYRRARQTTITSELLDVVSGFQAITKEGR